MIARLEAEISETNLMLMNFESAYPTTCAMTSAILSPMSPPSIPSKLAAANGLRNAYIQKYAVNAAPIAYAENAVADAVSNLRRRPDI